MKKKNSYALGSLLLGVVSWACLQGLRRIEKRMQKKKNAQKKGKDRSPAGLRSFFPPVSYAFRILCCNRMRSAIMAMNSLLVGLPLMLETV